MSFSITFNATQVAPNTGVSQVFDAGTYDVALISSSEKAVKDKPGQTYAELIMQILTGPNKGGKIVDRLNLKNQNQQAVDIAYSTLSSLCYVTNTMHIQQSTMELHGKPFKVEIRKEERPDKPGVFGNEIVRYMDMAGREPGQQGAAAPAATAPAAAVVPPAVVVAAPAAVAPIATAPATVAAGNAAPSWAT